MTYFVYILASRQHGTLYTGVTNDLARRIHEHRNGAARSFSRQYRVSRLVYYEAFDDPESAIAREKNLKRWRRAWKIQAIEKTNPRWRDLHEDLNR